MRKSGFIPMLDDITSQTQDKKANKEEQKKHHEQELLFEKASEQEEINSEEIKTLEAQGSRVGSRGKSPVANIKVVSN